MNQFQSRARKTDIKKALITRNCSSVPYTSLIWCNPILSHITFSRLWVSFQFWEFESNVFCHCHSFCPVLFEFVHTINSFTLYSMMLQNSGFVTVCDFVGWDISCWLLTFYGVVWMTTIGVINVMFAGE